MPSSLNTKFVDYSRRALAAGNVSIIGQRDRFPSNPNIIQIDFSSESNNRLPGGRNTFQVVSSSKNDAAVYSSAVWPALSPPEAPNIRPSLAPLNCHTSVLHIASPFLHA